MATEAAQAYFLDSNVWIYALTKNQDSHKRDVASQLIKPENVIVSTQVINEVCVNLIRKASFSNSQVKALISDFYKSFEVVSFTASTLTKATELRENYSISFWDSLILASALHAKTSILYSEDMQHRLTVENRLMIVNPFAK